MPGLSSSPLAFPCRKMDPFADSAYVVVGQTPYHSRVAQRIEYLAVALGIVGGKGNDVILVDLVRDLMACLDLADGVDVGTRAFTVKNGSSTPDLSPLQRSLGSL